MSDEESLQDLVDSLNRAPLEAFDAVCRIEPCTARELSKELDVTEPTAQERARDLYKAGVIDREVVGNDAPGTNPYAYEAVDSEVSTDPTDASHLTDQRATTSDPWRQRCPKGHSSLTTYTDTYQCNACGRTYEGEPYDAKKVDFPIDDEGLEKQIGDDVLEALVRKCQNPTTETVRAKQIDVGTPKQVGRVLGELRKDGLVEAIGSESWGYRWRPTDRGVRRDRGESEAAAPRQRAQADPTTLGLLTLLVGLLLVASAAIANGVVL